MQTYPSQTDQGGNPSPPEFHPDQGDTDEPGHAPEEETPGGGDTVQPGESPQEAPAQPAIPNETPAPD